MDIKRVLVTFLICITTLLAWSQQTVVKGVVKDLSNGEPLPFVSVYFKDTKIGATTDINGRFVLETYYASDTLIATFVGYARKAIKIKKDVSQELNISMIPSATGLQEVTVTADRKAENPAHPIIRRVIANKKINDREKLTAYQYEAYNKVEFDVNNLDDEFKNRKLLKPFKFIFDYIDSTGEKPYLPIFISEAISDFYFRNNPKAQFEYIKAAKVSGVENQSITQFLGDMYQGVNIYDNNIIAFNRSFISPISTAGFTYYKYYLVDSLYIGNDYCYQIDYLPKRKQEPTFKGTLWINDTTYAVKKVEANIAEDANVNFINSFFVRQEFEQVQKEVWMLKKDQLLVDFNVTDRTMGFYGRKTSTFKNHVINEPKAFDFYNVTDNIQVAADASQKQGNYWDTARHEILTDQEKAIYNMIDSIKDVPQFKTILDVLNIVINGYKEVGKFDIGPYSTFYSFNPIEGNRFRFGGTTNKNLSKRIIFDAYGAYGLKDQEWKYKAGFYYFLSKKPRSIVGASYSHDIEQLGQSQTALAQGNVLSSVFRRSPATKLTFTDQSKAYLEHEWFPGFSNRITLSNRKMSSLGTLQYNRFDGEGLLVKVPKIVTSEISLYTRFAYKERFIYGEFERVSLGTRFPIFEAEAIKAIKGAANSQFDYTKLYGSIQQDLKLSIFGTFTYRVEAGKVFGRAPYPLLEVHKGNETFFYNDYSFNTMNFFEFVSDQYTAVSLEHHFEGFFLNRIPLLRKLKWREVAGIKGIVGTYNEENSAILKLTDNLFTLNRGPYLESAIGIENIFKVLRLDLLYRMRYLDNPNIVKLALRAKFQINF